MRAAQLGWLGACLCACISAFSGFILAFALWHHFYDYIFVKPENPHRHSTCPNLRC